MTNLLVTFLHGDPSHETVREAPGRALQAGEVVPQVNSGQVLICSDHDITATKALWTGGFPDGRGVYQAANPSYNAGGNPATVIARRGAAVYVDLDDTGAAYQPDPDAANYNPYNVIVFAKSTTSIGLGVVAQKDIVQTDATFAFRHTQKASLAIGGTMS